MEINITEITWKDHLDYVINPGAPMHRVRLRAEYTARLDVKPGARAALGGALTEEEDAKLVELLRQIAERVRVELATSLDAQRRA
jgi:hypothetical protein